MFKPFVSTKIGWWSVVVTIRHTMKDIKLYLSQLENFQLEGKSWKILRQFSIRSRFNIEPSCSSWKYFSVCLFNLVSINFIPNRASISSVYFFPYVRENEWKNRRYELSICVHLSFNLDLYVKKSTKPPWFDMYFANIFHEVDVILHMEHMLLHTLRSEFQLK